MPRVLVLFEDTEVVLRHFGDQAADEGHKEQHSVLPDDEHPTFGHLGGKFQSLDLFEDTEREDAEGDGGHSRHAAEVHHDGLPRADTLLLSKGRPLAEICQFPGQQPYLDHVGCEGDNENHGLGWCEHRGEPQLDHQVQVVRGVALPWLPLILLLDIHDAVGVRTSRCTHELFPLSVLPPRSQEYTHGYLADNSNELDEEGHDEVGTELGEGMFMLLEKGEVHERVIVHHAQHHKVFQDLRFLPVLRGPPILKRLEFW
mmetsp:Transcript_10608/g.27491  ORF Transcript_10608/g.27491 Transcript_10608/m.27491 type:complete len:258 (-) Transcript_10608:332-1105(-)